MRRTEKVRIAGPHAGLSSVLLALVFVSLVCVGRAVAAPELDQQQTTLKSDAVLALGGNSHQILGQVVKSGIPGVLSQVDLPINCGSSPLVVQIVESTGSPGAMVLATQTYDVDPDPITGWRSFTLASPPFIPADSLFGVVLSTTGGCGVAFTDTDLYLPGGGWFQSIPNPPGVWLPFGGDIGFKTYVERMCKVPSLLDLSEEDARTLIQEYGCALGKIARAYSKTVPRGQTISQGQTEGTTLPAGSPVDFVVSLGLRPCRVPNVVGRKLSAARSAIAIAQCKVGKVKRQVSRKVKLGHVVSQRPKAGKRLPAKGKVNLVVSRGRGR